MVLSFPFFCVQHMNISPRPIAPKSDGYGTPLAQPSSEHKVHLPTGQRQLRWRSLHQLAEHNCRRLPLVLCFHPVMPLSLADPLRDPSREARIDLTHVVLKVPPNGIECLCAPHGGMHPSILGSMATLAHKFGAALRLGTTVTDLVALPPRWLRCISRQTVCVVNSAGAKFESCL